mmetsp:Transcript_23889/g.60951  ORF Transcript_23889/g.60951 Transcript_23889/m.60951 type:complete len:139 (+) Transcript_23889:43-459(+)
MALQGGLMMSSDDGYSADGGSAAPRPMGPPTGHVGTLRSPSPGPGRVAGQIQPQAEGADRAGRLQGQIQNIHTQFGRAQDELRRISGLCSTAETRIKKTKDLQNHMAREFHTLAEQTRALLQGLDGGGGAPGSSPPTR